MVTKVSVKQPRSGVVRIKLEENNNSSYVAYDIPIKEAKILMTSLAAVINNKGSISGHDMDPVYIQNDTVEAPVQGDYPRYTRSDLELFALQRLSQTPLTRSQIRQKKKHHTISLKIEKHKAASELVAQNKAIKANTKMQKKQDAHNLKIERLRFKKEQKDIRQKSK